MALRNEWMDRGEGIILPDQGRTQTGKEVGLSFWGSMRDPDFPILLFQKKNGTRITDVEWIRRGCSLLTLVSLVEKYLLPP